ncbi:hypothetical protein IMW82_00830 [Rhodanobacter sp. B2A1Ga4]|uniref:hypothetical protein n=1 Tax=Rhodanobacter sp. B2A1Ga4 TaxID=2778647 RepID=UPI001B38D530|nr:hypothetical protein [Rhodanobacter sp. B2A1Ga4]MBQ4853225.1 hypothetical protein [Rhodanobacter sp. B2A1Ga4]
MARPCSVCECPDRAQAEIGLANGIAVRVLGLRFGLAPDALQRHKQNHMDASLVARLRTRGHRSDEELAHIREVESKSLLDHLVWQRGRLYRNSDRAFALGDFAGERAALEAAGKASERIGKLLGELGAAITINHNTQINLVQSPEWHRIRTALVRELRPLGAEAIAAGARAISAAESSITPPVLPPSREALILEALPHE